MLCVQWQLAPCMQFLRLHSLSHNVAHYSRQASTWTHVCSCTTTNSQVGAFTSFRRACCSEESAGLCHVHSCSSPVDQVATCILGLRRPPLPVVTSCCERRPVQLLAHAVAQPLPLGGRRHRVAESENGVGSASTKSETTPAAHVFNTTMNTTKQTWQNV